MSTLVEQAVYMRGMNHSARDRELRIEVQFPLEHLRPVVQPAILEAIDRMTHVVTDSLTLKGKVLRCRIDCGKAADWEILNILDRAETEVFKTVKAVAKQYQTTVKAKPVSESDTETATPSSSPNLTLLVGGSKRTKPRYSNNDPRTLPRRRR